MATCTCRWISSSVPGTEPERGATDPGCPVHGDPKKNVLDGRAIDPQLAYGIDYRPGVCVVCGFSALIENEGLSACCDGRIAYGEEAERIRRELRDMLAWREHLVQLERMRHP